MNLSKQFKKMKRYLAAALCWIAATTTWAQQEPDGMEHRLQPWPTRDRFESARGAEHLFLSGSMGADFSWASNNLFRQENRGCRAALYVGKWFTPEHGLRTGIHARLLNHTQTKVKLFGVTADYLLNLSALTGGYRPERVFELYGVAGLGVDLGFQASRDDLTVSPNGHLGVQGSFRLSPITRFFIEPRLEVGDDRLDRRDHWRKFDAAFTLQAGFTYEILERSQRANPERAARRPFGDHLFVSFGAGITRMLTSNYTAHAAPHLSLAVGNWFTPSSGLRLGATGGMTYLHRPNDAAHRLSYLEAKADYLLHLNHLCGRDRQDAIDLVALAGVNYGVASSYLIDKRHGAWGFGVGLQANVHLNSHTDFFLEPRVTFYQDRFATGTSTTGLDLLTELTAGFTLNSESRAVRRTRNREAHDEHRPLWNHLFVELGAGAQQIATRSSLLHGNLMGPVWHLNLGKWWTPTSGLQIGVEGGWSKDRNRTENPKLYTASVKADYLWNITNTWCGYDEARRVYLIGKIGALLTARAGNRPSKSVHLGGEAALQGVWQAAPRVGLYLQPQIQFYNKKLSVEHHMRGKFTALTSLQAGVNVRLNNYPRQASRERYESDRYTWFVSGTAGSGSITNRNFFDLPGTRVKIAAGHWYTPLSAWRIQASAHWSRTAQRLNNYYIGVEPEYLLNLTNLSRGYDPDRVFQLNALAGVSIGTSRQNGKHHFVTGAHIGLQPDFRLCRRLHLFVEPRAGIYQKSYDVRDHGFVPTIEFNAGLTLLF